MSAGVGTTITLDSDGAAGSLSEGTYTGCELTGTDDAGNSATITLSTFTIDTTAPTITISVVTALHPSLPEARTIQEAPTHSQLTATKILALLLP